MTARVVAYLRVSTDEQAASGLGLDAQWHACRTWAERENCTLVGPHQDDVSGAAPLDRRPGLLDALAALDPGDVLIVAKRDRLGRDPIVIAMIESAASRKRCRIVSAAGEGTESDDPSAVLMRRMVDAFAEYERLIIKARTKAALSAKRRRGERTGQVPYGWILAEDGRALIRDDAEHQVLADVHRHRAAGRTLRWIAHELTRRGVPPKNGKPHWTHTTIAALLKRDVPRAQDLDEQASA
jgi:DNA invertase Pin-like site-specific DNA recombinase